MGTDLSAWWRDVRPRLVPLGDAAPLSPEELATALRESLGERLAPDDTATRVALPRGYRALLDVIGTTTWLGQRIALDFLLVPAAGVRARFEHALELYGDEGDVGPRGAGVWVEIAQRGDRTVWFLCCDRGRPEYGRVGVGDDAHPWLNGAEWIRPLVTLDAWLERIRATPLRPRSPVLLALDAPDLAGVRAASPDAVCAVREVVDRRTPDAAWSRTLDATERALMLRDAAAMTAAVRAAGAVLICATPSLDAWLLDAPAGPIAPSLAPWSVLAWDAARNSLRPVEDATACARGFVDRARAEGHALLWVVERDG